MKRPTSPDVPGVRAAAKYLESRARDGRWRGFATLAGTSDVWVSGFVAAHLASIAPRGRAVAAARRFLAEQIQESGGFGYGSGVPADADSTAWCLVAMGRARGFGGRRLRAAAFLASHLDAGGVRTYMPDSGIREFISAGAERSVVGWTAPHADVTAAALLADVAAPASVEAAATLSWLASRQSPAGFTEAYWWRGPYYGTALALRAFSHHRVRPTATYVERCRDALGRKRLPHGGYGLGASLELDPFSTALALEALCHLAEFGGDEDRCRVAGALASAQQPSGAWAGDFVLRIPSPDVVEPSRVHRWAEGTGGGNSFVMDREGTFATTLAAHALWLHARVESGRYDGISPGWSAVEPLRPERDASVVVVPVANPPEAERC